MALCGFDSNAARRDLATARFLRVIISGCFPLEEMKGLESFPILVEQKNCGLTLAQRKDETRAGSNYSDACVR